MNEYSSLRGMRRKRLPKALQRPVVKTANNGLLADLADFRGFARRKNRLG
jgi:hypothetical protein